MEERYKIFVDRLSHGQVEKIDETYPPTFINVADENHRFSEDVKVVGEAYVANSHLVLHLDVTTECKTHCKICNEEVVLPVELRGLYITEDIETIPGKILDIRDPLRDAILLEVPLYNECEGNCPRRAEYDAFMSKQRSSFKEE